jgi:hypothetical protein
VAEDPTLVYESTDITCDTSTVVGRTGLSGFADVVNLELDFSGNCDVGGLGADVSCAAAFGDDDGTGTLMWHALTFDTNEGEVDRLNTGFSCVLTVTGVCTVTFGEQELPVPNGINPANLLGEGGTEQIDLGLISRLPGPAARSAGRRLGLAACQGCTTSSTTT